MGLLLRSCISVVKLIRFAHKLHEHLAVDPLWVQIQHIVSKKITKHQGTLRFSP